MKNELKDKYVPPYFYKFRPPPSIQSHRSNTLSSPPAKFTSSNQTMESQLTLDDITAKINNLLQIINSSNQNSKSNAPCVIPIVRKIKEKSDNNESKNTEKDFSKISPTIKCYKCQGYGHVANCPSKFKIVINDRNPIEAPKLAGTIFSKVTVVIKEFTVTCLFSSPGLLPTPPSLLLTPAVVPHFGHQSFPLLLPTPSPFLLWPMLSTKSKFSTNLIPLADQYKVIDSASSFASHVHNHTMKSVIKLHKTMSIMRYELMIGID